jgi:hypothetical protein
MVTSVENVSDWVDGCPIGPSGILASIGVAWDYVDMCGWVVCGICVFGMFASVVVRTWPRLLGLGLRPDATLQVSFWVAFHGGFFSS